MSRPLLRCCKEWQWHIRLALIPAQPPPKESTGRRRDYAPFPRPTPFRPATAITEAWETLREGLETTPFLTLTGYGRQLVDFADKQVTEISCHGLGARFLAPATRAVIDIGGQDSKVIQLDDDGNLCDFLMNDKCVVGTGRFLR